MKSSSAEPFGSADSSSGRQSQYAPRPAPHCFPRSARCHVRTSHARPGHRSSVPATSCPREAPPVEPVELPFGRRADPQGEKQRSSDLNALTRMPVPHQRHRTGRCVVGAPDAGVLSMSWRSAHRSARAECHPGSVRAEIPAVCPRRNAAPPSSGTGVSGLA